MKHDTTILCLCFSNDNKYLGSGSNDGVLKIWEIGTGKCMRKILAAHSQGITSVSFSKDNWQLLTSSYDMTVRIHGLKSGKMLKEFRGHNSYVNHVIYTNDNKEILSCSSDSTIKVWNVHTTECLYTFKPICYNEVADTKVNCIWQLPQNNNEFIVCNRTNNLEVCRITGDIIKSINSGRDKDDKENSDFINCILSPKGRYVYCVGDNNHLYCFDYRSGDLESEFEVYIIYYYYIFNSLMKVEY